MYNKVLFLFALFWISGYAYTQDSLDYADTIRLEDLVFVGQRIETTLNDRPEAISLINTRQLNALSPMSLPEAMSIMPGVFMQKTNQGGGSPFVRGLTGYQTLTLAWQHHKQNDVQLYHKLITGDYSSYEFDPQLRDLLYLRHEITRNHPLFSGMRTTLSMHQSDETRRKQRTGSKDLYTERDRVRSLGFILEFLTHNDRNWEGVSGYELYYDRLSSSTLVTALVSGTDSTFRGLYPDDSWMSNMSLFSLHTLNLGKLKLNGCDTTILSWV